MIALSLEGRYARALFSLSDRYEKILNDLESLYIFFKNNRYLYRLLCGISLKKESRFLMAINIVKKLNLDESLESFLKLLVDYNRLNLLTGIKNIYHNMVNDVLNRVHFVVETATILNDEEKKQLEASLETKFKKKVLASYLVSPHLIGGFSIKTDGHCWDISFRAQLKQLEKILIPHY